MHMKDSGRFGINMKRFCREHEGSIEKSLADGAVTTALLETHLEKIRWLQHERLVHLIVLVMTVIAELLAVYLALTHPETDPAAACVVLVLAILLGFYFYHYFFLENAVQRWYRLAEQMMDELAGNRPGRE